MDEDMDPSSWCYHHTCQTRFEKSAEILCHWLLAVLTGRQMKLVHYGWGFKLIWHGFHIHSIHIQGDWQPSYAMAMDGDMDPSSRHYHHTCQPSLGSRLKSCVTAWRQLKPLGTGWGSKPTWHGSHIPSIHIQGDWQPSYAIDGKFGGWIRAMEICSEASFAITQFSFMLSMVWELCSLDLNKDGDGVFHWYLAMVAGLHWWRDSVHVQKSSIDAMEMGVSALGVIGHSGGGRGINVIKGIEIACCKCWTLGEK